MSTSFSVDDGAMVFVRLEPWLAAEKGDVGAKGTMRCDV